MKRSWVSVLAVVVATAFGVVACGSGDDDDDEGGPGAGASGSGGAGGGGTGASGGAGGTGGSGGGGAGASGTGGGAGAGGGVMGGGGSGAGGAGGSGGVVPIGATFSSLKANVFTPLCKNCHGTTYEKYDELVVAVPTKAGNDACVKDPAYAGKPILIAGDAANSLLYKKLALDDSGCGARMPQGGAPLSQEQIDAVKQWIDAGANDN